MLPVAWRCSARHKVPWRERSSLSVISMGSDQPAYLIASRIEQLANIVEPDLTRIVLGVGSKDEDAVLLFDF